MAGAPVFVSVRTPADQYNREPARMAPAAPAAPAAAPAAGYAYTQDSSRYGASAPQIWRAPAGAATLPESRGAEGGQGLGGRGRKRKTRRTRRKTPRRRGGGTNPSEWIVELYRTPTRETLDRVVGEIRRSSGNRNLVITVDGVVNMLRFPLGTRETREQRLAEVIRRVIFHLREQGGPIPPPNAENVKGVLGIKGVSARGFAPGGVEFPKDVENRLVGFLAPSGKDDSVDRALGEIAALKGKRLPAPALPPGGLFAPPPPGGTGPAAAGAGGPAGGRRRSTRRRR
jgi:hypothetical protein